MIVRRSVLEDVDMRSRANTGESLRRPRHPKLYHSRSDDNRRRSFDKHRRDSQQASRYSLNTQVVVEGCAPEYELKYFAASSLETDPDSRANSEESRVVESDEGALTNDRISSEAPVDNDALLEEPELENLTDVDDESNSSDDHDSDDQDKQVQGTETETSKLQPQPSRSSGRRRLVTQETVVHVEPETH